MPVMRIEINGYEEVRKYLKEGPVFCKIAADPFTNVTRLVIRDVRKVHGFMQVKVLEGWQAGPFEMIWIEREREINWR
jgi:hypothetical protein